MVREDLGCHCLAQVPIPDNMLIHYPVAKEAVVAVETHTAARLKNRELMVDLAAEGAVAFQLLVVADLVAAAVDLLDLQMPVAVAALVAAAALAMAA